MDRIEVQVLKPGAMLGFNRVGEEGGVLIMVYLAYAVFPPPGVDI